MPWNPDQYNKFQSQRAAPFDDLLKLVRIRPGLKVIDLGCGTGELTKRLFDVLPESNVLGIDNSPQMLSKTNMVRCPGLFFSQGDQSNLHGSWDLIFSNAALQWSENHPVLLNHLYSKLTSGGQIVVQIPSNHNHISHRLISETAQEEPFRSTLHNFVRTTPVMSIDQYAQIFFELGAENIIVYEKIYCHVLENSNAVVEWISGTALVPYFERLGTEKNAFLLRLREKFQLSIPDNPVFFPFRRILFSAHKPRQS